MVTITDHSNMIWKCSMLGQNHIRVIVLKIIEGYVFGRKEELSKKGITNNLVLILLWTWNYDEN